MYHSISERATWRFRAYTVTPTAFAEQMSYLARAGYEPITVSQDVELSKRGGTSLPARPVVLTFDDGYEDFYAAALPVLRRHGFVATLYVCTAYIGGTSQWLRWEREDERTMLSWDQL